MQKTKILLFLSVIICFGNLNAQVLNPAPKKIYAGIEIGARGVKLSIITVQRKAHHYGFVFLKDGSKNTQVIDFTPKAIQETSDAVKAFFDTITNYNNGAIPLKNIFIAISSGVKQEAFKVKGRDDTLLAALKDAVPGYTKPIEFLDPCTEGDLTIKGIVPSQYLYNSALVDVGSGNTKGGFRMGGTEVAECFTIPWGTSTLSKRMSKMPKESMQQFFNDSINSAVVGEIASKPGLTNRKHNYLSGGIYWAICNYLYPAKIKQDYTMLTAKDIDKFLDAAINNYGVLIQPDLSGITDAKELAEAQKQIDRTHATFTQDNIIAATLLVKSIFNEFDKRGIKGKNYVFSRYAYIGWISGYIVKNI